MNTEIIIHNYMNIFTNYEYTINYLLYQEKNTIAINFSYDMNSFQNKCR